KNLGLKVLALGLAVILWWFVAGESNVHVGFAVPLEIRNIPSGMAITNKVDRQVDVRLAGPSTLINTLQQTGISAAVDLSGAKAGRETIPLSERSVKVPAGFRVERVYPAYVEVILEKLERKTVPVLPQIKASSRVRTRIEKTIVDPPTLEVEALPDEFSRLKTLTTEEITPETTEGVFTARARVNLPEGHVKIVGNPDVLVTIHFRK
ncbi:MAG: CdaR family protein, partial [Candidatus Deferrimicrobiaceae bacterium]